MPPGTALAMKKLPVIGSDMGFAGFHRDPHRLPDANADVYTALRPGVLTCILGYGATSCRDRPWKLARTALPGVPRVQLASALPVCSQQEMRWE